MDKRRAARIRTPFFLAIEGIDSDLVMRQGNISASGLYVELPKPMGEPGSVEWLHLGSIDGVHRIHVMAHVVRTITFSDDSRGHGIALQFMPDNEVAEEELQSFVAYVLARKLSSAALRQVRPSTPPEVQAAPPTRAAGPSVRSIEVEGSWAFAPNEVVEVVIHSPKSGHWVRCEATVARVAETEADRSRLVVSATSESKGGGLPLTEEDLEDWMSRFLVAPERLSGDARAHLSGVLSRIRLPAILSLLEMDRMTGELALSSDGENVTMYVREGRVLDAVGPSSERAIDLVRDAFLWPDGTFRFDAKPIDRDDVLATSTTALILDLARQLDEAASTRGEDIQ